MSKGLVSPRIGGRPLGDFGTRSPLVARQRVGRVKRHADTPRLPRLLTVTGLLLLLALAGAGGLWVLTAPRFAIADVEVHGASRLPVDRILDAAGIRLGTNLLRLDTAAVIARLEELPEIRRAELIREFPNRVTINVEERRPFTLLHSGRLHWVDEEGRLLGEERDAVAPPAPLISGLSEAEVETMREAPSPRARAAIALIRALLRSGSTLANEISEIDMSRHDGPVLYTLDGIEVRLGNEQWEERLARLEGVLAEVAGQGGGVTAVDLRFRDQVVLQKGAMQ
ncbi:MAG TPA: FtsQ-type POTRA domain-containing protein [Methylomirabilota bacterium]